MFRFWRLKFEVSEEAKSFISDFLLGLNSAGVAEDILEDRGVIEVSAYFPKEMDLNPVIESLKNYTSFLEGSLPGIRVGNTTVEEIDRSSWEIWKQELKTVRASKTVIIRPPWERYIANDGEIVIEINPSMAFGTGHHETTRLCVQSMEEIIQNARVKKVLDVGCGSGILAISAVRLGAHEAIGLDTDPVAIDEATKNLKRNSLLHKVKLFCGPIESVRGKFDLIVVNISAEVIFLIREQVKSRLKKGGKLIASGISYSRRDEVVRGLKGVGLILDRELRDGEWIALLFDVDKNRI
jgi:ribosomal protein L11 methyltransferase